MRSFLTCTRGGVAIAFALALVPVLAAAGAALDYNRADAARGTLAVHADAAALRVAATNTAGDVLAQTQTRLTAELGARITDLDVDGEWLDDRHYRVVVTGRTPTTLLRAVPALSDGIALQVVAVARRTPPTYRTLPPQRTQLDPEAGDYNRVYMYCYDPMTRDQPQRGRSGLTPVADNGTPPTDYSDRRMPDCGPGEVLSYMLRNVRNARSNRAAWDRATEEVYEYYADATVDPRTGRVTHDVRGFRVYNGTRREPLDMTSAPILETILCDTAAACRPVRDGGIIPNRRTGRTPAVATGACSAGKFMYFGWEDRPPGFGWTDTDYDDIRLVVSCPEIIEVNGRAVVLVR